ncbi:18790_t:CDS:2 [Dentiscutata erythropus]|uniref:18790_t:CDS:1 n=1 Tax=Dentiscutata erythropus TaxID=1348616 RepID=A0A9N9IP81_9GLOM|nr:18790_t:CDS:2 [Dentiscutata erythropus]
MPNTLTAICYITDYQEKSTNKDLIIVKAAGVTRLRNSNTDLSVLLVAFYSTNKSDDNLASFSTEDVLLVTEKFRIIILSDIVYLDIDPVNLPKSTLLLNMTAVTKEAFAINEDHATISLTVETKYYLDQDNVTQEFECHHLVFAKHLAWVSSIVKKGSTIYISGELLLVEDTFVVHLRNLNFFEFPKSVNMKAPANLS